MATRWDWTTSTLTQGGGCSSVSKTIITKIRLDAETETLIPTIGGHFVEPLMFDTQQITSASNRTRVEAGLPCSTLNKSGNACIALAGNTIGRKPENGGNGTGYDATGSSYTLTKTDVHAVAFKIRGGCEGGGKGYLGSEESAFTLSTHADQHLHPVMQVRRLTPRECERLQGFPDDFTLIPSSSDTTRYKALGNSMAVNAMQVLGERIQMVGEIAQTKEIAA